MFNSMIIANHVIKYTPGGRIIVFDPIGSVLYSSEYSPGKLKRVIKFLSPSVDEKARRIGYFSKASEMILSPVFRNMEVLPDDDGNFLLASPCTPEEANMKLFFRSTPGQEGAIDASFKKSSGFSRGWRYEVQNEGDFISFTKIEPVSFANLFSHFTYPIFTVY